MPDTPLTYAGRADQLESFVMRDMLLRLFFTRSGDTVKETTGDGYAPIKLKFADWTLDGLTAVAKPKTFKFTKPIDQSIGGYFCTRPDDDTPIYIEDFASDEPYTIKRAGEGVAVTAKFKL